MFTKRTCCNCAHWWGREAPRKQLCPVAGKADGGECTVLVSYITYTRGNGARAQDNKNIITDANFGCVHWSKNSK